LCSSTTTGIFADNLRSLLLTPPLFQYLELKTSDLETKSAVKCEELVVCGVDPGFSHGHKVSEFTLIYHRDNINIYDII
jgi:transcriptional accessory protein Tex/SPT6